MSPEERADRIRALVDAAPPLTEAQAAVLRSAMCRARPLAAPAARSRPRRRVESEAPMTNGAPPSPQRIGIETDLRTLQTSDDGSAVVGIEVP